MKGYISSILLRKSLFKVFIFTFWIVLWHLTINMVTDCYGYNAGSSPSVNEAHQWITRKAVNYVLNNSNNISLRFYRDILNSHLGDLLEGVWRADNTGSTTCKWYANCLDIYDYQKEYDCDQLHHYFHGYDIKSWAYVRVADPGDSEFIAPKYADGLYNVAVKFFPGGETPSLENLEFVYAGKTKLESLPWYNDAICNTYTTGDLKITYIGGFPQCQRYYEDILKDVYTENPYPDDMLYCLNSACDFNLKYCPNDDTFYPGEMYCGFTDGDLKDLGCYSAFRLCLRDETTARAMSEASDYCPTWPRRYSNQHISGDENISDAMFYLGWTLHLIQDLTVPYHVINSAIEAHQNWEDFISNAIKNPTQEIHFHHLPLHPGTHYNYDNTIPAHIDYYNDMSTGILDFAKKIATETYHFYEERKDLNDMVRKEILLDIAIKASAAVIEKFFRDITPPDDVFEENDSIGNARELILEVFPIINDGYAYMKNYTGLVIYPQDPDCYRIQIPENFMDLSIDVRYGKITGEEGVTANLYKGNDILQGFYQTDTSSGKHIGATGLLAGNDYVVCLNSGKSYPFTYEIDIKLLPNVYLQNNPQIDVIPNSITLRSLSDKGMLTIYNRGGKDLHIYSMTTEPIFLNIGPLFKKDFNYGSNPCGSPQITLSPLQSCTVGISVNPALTYNIGEAYSGTLTISSDDPDQANITTDLLFKPSALIIGGFETYLPIIKPDAPYIFAPEAKIDFGDVLTSGEMTLGVNISNIGGKDLVINSISIQDISQSKSESGSFTYDMYGQITKEGGVIVPPGGLVTIYVTFNPEEIGSQSANLIIESNDPEHPQIIIPVEGRGFMIIPGDFDRDLDVDQNDIKIVLYFFDESVKNGTLIGLGPGKSAKNRLNALRNMIVSASNLIGAGDTSGACTQLMDAYKKTDGQPRPPDFVAGEAASELAAMIEQLTETLCK